MSFTDTRNGRGRSLKDLTLLGLSRGARQPASDPRADLMAMVERDARRPKTGGLFCEYNRPPPLATRRKSPWNSRNEMIAEVAVGGLAGLLRGFFFAGLARA